MSHFSKDHISDNDFVEVSVSVIGSWGYTRGEAKILWQELRFEILFWRRGVHPVATQYNNVQHYVQ